MVAPTTAISSATNTSVRISWTAPNTNGAAISSYKIEIKVKSGGTFSANTANCNGALTTIVN
jgi:hypothetical protein